MLTLDVHSDRPDETEKLSADRGDHLLVGHASFIESAIAPMEAALSFPGHLFHRLLESLLAFS